MTVGEERRTHDIRPIPDPTILTTEALNREIATLRESIEIWRDGFERLLLEKDGHITSTLQSETSRIDDKFEQVESEMRTRLSTLQEIIDSQLAKVSQRFELQEQQRIEQKNDTKAAVDAALTAQKEAVKEQTTASSLATQKSETATNKSLEQQATAAATEAAALRRSIDELKERIGETDRNARTSVTDLERNLRSSISEVAQATNGYGQRQQGGMDFKSNISWVLSAILAVTTIAAIIFAVN